MGLVERNRSLNAEEIRAGKIVLESKPLRVNFELIGYCNIVPPCLYCSGKNFGYNYAPLDAGAHGRDLSNGDRHLVLHRDGDMRDVVRAGEQTGDEDIVLQVRLVIGTDGSDLVRLAQGILDILDRARLAAPVPTSERTTAREAPGIRSTHDSATMHS